MYAIRSYYARRGIGEATADRLIRYSMEREMPLWEVLRDPALVPDLGEKAGEAIAPFVELMERYRQRFARGRALDETARQFYAEIGLEDEIYREARDPA